METIKIQIIHNGFISKQVLSSYLYDEIGEEYNFSKEYIENFFEILNTFLLPNNSFSTTFTFSLPELKLRDIEPKDIVFSYLNSLQNNEQIISVVKTTDYILQETAEKYYKEIIDIEMELRNVLTYILSYDDKNIENQLFKNFGINKSENIDYDKARKNYENGLFYIYFNHYASFSQPKKVKADQIAELLQDPTIQSFDDFKNKISDRAIRENRHTKFLLSIKTKLKPIENMRNAIMHIRNFSKDVIDNYKKTISDNNGDKGVNTLIQEFWQNERDVLNEKTWLALAESQIKKIITIEKSDDSRFYRMNTDYYDDEFEESYENIEEFREDLISYLIDKIELPDFNAETEEFLLKINELIDKTLKISLT